MALNNKYMNVDSYRIRFQEKGEGFPLLLMHGLGASLEWWQYNVNSLSRKYRVITLDFLGFGYSSRQINEYSLSYASKFLISFLDTLEIDKAFLLGNSMGGLISLSVALEYPERIEKLVLVDNAGFGRELSFILRLGSLFPVGELALALRNKFTVNMLLSQLFYDPQKLPPDLVDCVLRIFNLPYSSKALLRTLRCGVDLQGLKRDVWKPLQEKISVLICPTLIIWGVQDKITPVNQAYRGQKLIEQAALYIFEKCGHMPQVEWAEEFNNLVLDFLES
jgi:4,5:9,10-diseco-3-hydroxy-5,9,17-trioxoandrosta-1(10),2-diene-4-oate hydrolase